MKVIIFNEYMQNIYLGFDEVLNYITKGVMENHYNYNILKNVKISIKAIYKSKFR